MCKTNFCLQYTQNTEKKQNTNRNYRHKNTGRNEIHKLYFFPNSLTTFLENNTTDKSDFPF